MVQILPLGFRMDSFRDAPARQQGMTKVGSNSLKFIADGGNGNSKMRHQMVIPRMLVTTHGVL